MSTKVRVAGHKWPLEIAPETRASRAIEPSRATELATVGVGGLVSAVEAWDAEVIVHRLRRRRRNHSSPSRKRRLKSHPFTQELEHCA